MCIMLLVYDVDYDKIKKKLNWVKLDEILK